jgi:hypothetical protein
METNVRKKDEIIAMFVFWFTNQTFLWMKRKLLIRKKALMGTIEINSRFFSSIFRIAHIQI